MNFVFLVRGLFLSYHVYFVLPRSFLGQEPQTLTEACTEFWHGGEISGGNRWFDKSMQLLVTKNGRVAYQGEHSMLDAAPTIAVIRKILKTTHGRLAKQQPMDELAPDKADVDAGVKNVFGDCWSDANFKEQALKLVEEARQHHLDLSSQFDLERRCVLGTLARDR